MLDLSPEREAIAVRREGDTHALYRASLDAAFELLGVLRTRWRGVTGGAEARAALDAFFSGESSPAATSATKAFMPELSFSVLRASAVIPALAPEVGLSVGLRTVRRDEASAA